MNAKEFLKEKYYYLTDNLTTSTINIGADDLALLVDEYANQSKWISVEDGMPPEYNQIVIVAHIAYEGSLLINEAWYNTDECMFIYPEIGRGKTEMKNVTHWQPLPEKP